MTEGARSGGAFWRPGRVRLVLGFVAFANLAMAATLLWALHGPGESGQLMDFGALWAAGQMAGEGRAADAYDLPAITAVQSEALGRDYEREMAWLYPPFLQLALIPFGLLPMLASQALWTGLTLALYLAVCRRILPDPGALLAALAPATVVLLAVNGQTGFLVAALGGIALLGYDEGRAGRGGVALGLLAVKPQVALMLPLPFLLRGPWRALGIAAAVVAALCIAATVVFGVGIWAAFLSGLEIASRDLGRPEVLDNQATLRAALVTAGAPGALGWAGQGALALAALGALLHTLRRHPAAAVAAAAAYASLAISPRVMDYDLLLLVIGGLFQARRIGEAGGPGWERAAMAAALLLPLADLLLKLPLNWLAAPLLLATLVAAEGRRAQSGSDTGPSTG
ncbi:MAG: glycosyltransferase family 87 protein [Pseudomonadota bacterium]